MAEDSKQPPELASQLHVTAAPRFVATASHIASDAGLATAAAPPIVHAEKQPKKHQKHVKKKLSAPAPTSAASAKTYTPTEQRGDLGQPLFKQSRRQRAGNGGNSPKAQRATPKAKGTTPKAKGATPKAKGTTPKAKGATPKANGDTTETPGNHKQWGSQDQVPPTVKLPGDDSHHWDSSYDAGEMHNLPPLTSGRSPSQTTASGLERLLDKARQAQGATDVGSQPQTSYPPSLQSDTSVVAKPEYSDQHDYQQTGQHVYTPHYTDHAQLSEDVHVCCHCLATLKSSLFCCPAASGDGWPYPPGFCERDQCHGGKSLLVCSSVVFVSSDALFTALSLTYATMWLHPRSNQ
jgi:hypothetical protein